MKSTTPAPVSKLVPTQDGEIKPNADTVVDLEVLPDTGLLVPKPLEPPLSIAKANAADFDGPLMEGMRPITSFTTAGHEHEELIRDHAFDRGTTMLLAGPTGIGKTSFLQQMAISFALGRPHLGLVPTKSMRILIIQAENEDIDIARTREGAFEGLQLSLAERKIIGKRVFIIRNFAKRGPEFFKDVVMPAVAHLKPDLLGLDPAFAYIGGDANKQQVVGEFMRDYVHSTNQQFNCGTLVCHHTPKPLLDARKAKSSERAYAGSGSAEWANFSRLVLTIEATHDPDHFVLHASKKVRELGWTDHMGAPSTFKHIRHAKDRLCWLEATPDSDSPSGINVEKALGLITGTTVSRDAYMELLLMSGAKTNTGAKSIIKQMIQQNVIKIEKNTNGDLFFTKVVNSK